MFVTKVLEKKPVIRLFGLALFLSPFVNTLASMAMRPSNSAPWTLQIFWRTLISGNFIDQSLYVSSVLIGLLMLQGSSSVWKFVLILLGGHLARQLMHLGENVRTHWVYGFFFLINISVFLFIADQLVWKQKKLPVDKAPPAPEPQSPPAFSPPPQVPAPHPASQARKKILIHFDGVGPWAQLMSVSNKGILVRSIAKPPDEIDSREIEISMRNGLTLRTRLTRSTEHEYFFEYVHLTSSEIHLLNQWLQQQAA